MRNGFEKVFMGAAGSAGGAGLDVDDVFSTHLYTGNATERDIVTGINLADEGGLLWIKNRAQNSDHSLLDTDGGARKSLNSNSTQSAYYSSSQSPANKDLKSINDNGFSIFNANYNANVNTNSVGYSSFSFRKAPKFFDVVTYTGNGTAGRTVSHNLSAVPAVMIVKCVSTGGHWGVYHRSTSSEPEKDYLLLSETAAAYLNQDLVWNNTAPTSTEFTLGSNTVGNGNNETYVAYLFAHHDGDGEFGPDGDQDIIKCGSYTGNGSSTGPVIDLGFEPQWLMIKGNSIAKDWRILDVMRGMPQGGNGKFLEANTSDAEQSDTGPVALSSTGFQLTQTGNATNNNNDTYIYMAIRRGPLAPPESASEVFDVKTKVAGPPAYVASMPQVDFALSRVTITSTGDTYASTRNAGYSMKINEVDAEPGSVVSGFELDHSFGIGSASSASSTTFSWMWKRAPGFFDIGFYKGNSTARTLPHQLGVVPEMYWLKGRNGATNWFSWHKDTANNVALPINSNAGFLENNAYFNNTAPTSSVISIGSNGDVNYNNNLYVFYCFASLPGISKVGSYTGTGSSFNVDCGFTSGAKWVMIKDTRGGDTFHFDTVRGITSGANDNRLTLSNTSARFASFDYINANSNGFNTGTIGTINTNGIKYIFYAIA